MSPFDQYTAVMVLATFYAVGRGAWRLADYKTRTHISHKQAGINWGIVASALVLVISRHLHGGPDEDQHFFAHVLLYVGAVWGAGFVVWCIFRTLNHAETAR